MNDPTGTGEFNSYFLPGEMPMDPVAFNMIERSLPNGRFELTSEVHDKNETGDWFEEFEDRWLTITIALKNHEVTTAQPPSSESKKCEKEITLQVIKPIYNTRFVYGDDAKLTIMAEASVSPAKYSGGITWSADPVAGRPPRFEPPDARGSQTTIVYEGLPEDNGQFGPKTISARLDAAGCHIGPSARSNRSSPTGRNIRDDARTPSERRARASQAKTSQDSRACPLLHPLKGKSLRQTGAVQFISRPYLDMSLDF